jgi:hypothetical protein
MWLHKSFFVIFALFAIGVSITAQNCDCESSFLWVKKTFEENDAGFLYVIDKRGKQSYDIHNQLFESKIQLAKTDIECVQLLNEWLYFFRKGHIGVELIASNIPEKQNEAIINYPNGERLDMDTIKFKEYLKLKQDFDFEGIWEDGVYTIGIKKIDNQFVGFIIDTQVKEWVKGQVKFKIYSDSVIYYMRDHSIKRLQKVQLASKNFLLFDGGFSFLRKYPKFNDSFLHSHISRFPRFEEINSNTLYFQIPHFAADKKESIDRILMENKEKIVSTPNLIIDLRYNGGGSDDSWNNLLPLIYTNPIRQKSCYLLSTELNNQQLNTYWGGAYTKELENNLGKFVLLFNQRYITTQFDTIYQYPKNIAVLVNEYCASSTEQFLLAAKQSKKVKIFGTVTTGALDFANMNTVESPCGNFKLYYAMSKDVDMEKYPIENIGVQPDFYLDDKIPEYQWIDYVQVILNNKME